MNNLNLDNITGKGLIFPLELNSKGSAVIKGGFDLIKSSITQIIIWYIGTRFMLGEYGTPLIGILEEPNDIVTQDQIEFNLIEKIPYWDKRFSITNVESYSDDLGKLTINVQIRLTNTDITETLTLLFKNGIPY